MYSRITTITDIDSYITTQHVIAWNSGYCVTRRPATGIVAVAPALEPAGDHWLHDPDGSARRVSRNLDVVSIPSIFTFQTQNMFS